MLTVKEFGVLGGACAAVLLAAAGVVATHSVDGLIHERDRLKAELGATAERPTPTETVTASPTASPAGASPPQTSPSPSAAPVVQAAAANPGQGAAPGSASTPPSPPASSSPSAPPPHCAAAETVKLRLPARTLSCNAVVIGGNG